MMRCQSAPSRPTTPRRPARFAGLFSALIVTGALGLAACSGGPSSSPSTTTTTTPRQFQVSTPDGQASLSLDGRLPPGWPSSVPVPSGAKPAGSGSLVGESSGLLVGVYHTTGSPQDAFRYYTSSSSITVESPASVGVGSAFVGTLRTTSPVEADVLVTSHQSDTYIVIVLHTGASSTSSTTTSS